MAPSLLANLIARYLETVGLTNLPTSFGQKRIITLQIGQGIRDKLLADFVPLNQTGVVAKNWERWLKGNDPYLAFTLDQSAADERRELAFITPTHPLARQAARAIAPTSPLFCSLTVTCAARYRHARQTSDTELRSRIVSHQVLDTAASVQIGVTLAETEWNIHFVGKHWFDLKTLIADPLLTMEGEFGK